MAQTISASQFKARCLGLMDPVAATGEVLVITKNGQPVVELHPCVPPRRPTPFGLHPGVEIHGDVLAPNRHPLVVVGVILLDTHVLLAVSRHGHCWSFLMPPWPWPGMSSARVGASSIRWPACQQGMPRPNRGVALDASARFLR